MSVTLAVTSGKGGTGKTMFSVNLAALLAMNESRVLIIDLNTGLRNVDICLGMENQVIYDLSDVVSGLCPLRRAMIRDDRFECLYLISASQDVSKARISDSDIKKIIDDVSSDFDFIIIDTPPALGSDWQSAVICADMAVVMLTQELASVRDADSVDYRLKKLGVKKRCAVINRLKSENYGGGESCFPSLTEIFSMIHMPVAGGIVEDKNIHLSMNSGVPVVCMKDSYVIENFKRIFLRMLDVYYG
ncbi:MAG: AAA family ATPase [Eubacteriales bacterium]|nr:AAA family ATPase [Eubacteriales bacterium]